MFARGTRRSAGASPARSSQPTESHVRGLTGHAKDAEGNYRRYCVGCHGERGDGNGENAVWIDPKPRDFTLATFKCRSTPTGTLPTDEDLFDTISRGLANSNMPVWGALTRQQRTDFVAYVKTFSQRWRVEKPGESIKIPPEALITIESISHGKSLYGKLQCGTCHGPQGKGDGPTAATLTDVKDRAIRPYDFSAAADDSRFKCGSTNDDLYRIFMTGLDGTPMPAYGDVIAPDEAWDLVHFLRTLQLKRHSRESEVLKAAGGTIPAHIEKSPGPPADSAKSESASAGSK